MTRRMLLLLAATWTWPSHHGVAQESVKSKSDSQSIRDFDLLEAVLKDILSKHGPDSILYNKKQLLFSLDVPDFLGDRRLKVSDVANKERLKDRSKLSPAQLGLALEAAAELVRRQNLKSPFKDFKPTDKRIVIWDKARGTQDPSAPGLLQAQVFRAFAPGYSQNRQLAIVYLTYPSDIHFCFGSYGLAKKEGKWVVLFRDFFTTL